MTSAKRQLEEGFTAIELLITLIIAAVFIFAGYQLYSQVVQEGADANRTARLSNATYAKLRSTTSDADTAYPSGCTFTTPVVTTSTQNVSGLGTITFTTTVSCPYVSASNSAQNVFLIRVDATDASGNTKVSHATYAN
jgi:prepilin-type N-terminal cleavage/methylation domain-containing protein